MQLIFLIYIILPIMLLYGSSVSGKGQWNDGFLSLSQSKALQGMCVLLIVFHHISQKIYVRQDLPQLITHSLDPFVNAGFLLTAVFFFFNGYGLYKSYTSKPGYLDHFLSKRLSAPLVAYYVTGLIFFALRLGLGEKIGKKLIILYLSGLVHCSPYSWYIVILILFYVVFYLVFKRAKDVRSATVIFSVIVLAYMILGLFIPRNSYFLRGEWWYNSVFMMPLGMFFAGSEDRIISHVKRNYGKYLAVHLVLVFPTFKLSEFVIQRFGYFNDSIPYGTMCKAISLLSHMLCVYMFIALILLISMKIKIGNRVLAFLGKYTLEIYLIHGILVEVFDHDFVGIAPSPIPVSSPFLYILCVIIAALPVSLLLKKIENWVGGLFSNR
ncbi:MAG: acyltransferase [Butyrivibrio sp.]|nr:acyltransferase [Butyrivibrio sp.]MBQ8031263.1 acyltransferase [Butyrivibrio sp.]MBR1641711.1 acyltransferase [Butyrivibrio sp.]